MRAVSTVARDERSGADGGCSRIVGWPTLCSVSSWQMMRERTVERQRGGGMCRSPLTSAMNGPQLSDSGPHWALTA
eukprot:COSAG06_NODE_54628_length_293_cov_1.324742_1_plen_75_part_01